MYVIALSDGLYACSLGLKYNFFNIYKFPTEERADAFAKANHIKGYTIEKRGGR